MQSVRHDETTNSIILDDGTPSGYKVAVERCDTPEKLLEWLGHLSQKIWFKPSQVDDLISVCENVTDIRRDRDC